MKKKFGKNARWTRRMESKHARWTRRLITSNFCSMDPALENKESHFLDVPGAFWFGLRRVHLPIRFFFVLFWRGKSPAPDFPVCAPWGAPSAALPAPGPAARNRRRPQGRARRELCGRSKCAAGHPRLRNQSPGSYKRTAKVSCDFTARRKTPISIMSKVALHKNSF